MYVFGLYFFEGTGTRLSKFLGHIRVNSKILELNLLKNLEMLMKRKVSVVFNIMYMFTGVIKIFFL